MSEPDPKPTAPKRDPAALSSEYHKAHKQLMLWAAVLLIWELVGVDLGKAKDAGGNVGPIVTALKSPQAVPWVLLGLVGYFLFKCSIEWSQCHVDRRKVRFARIDFFSGWVVSIVAIALYVGQAIGRVQFADTFGDISAVWALVAGITFMIGAVMLTMDLIDKQPFKEMRWTLFFMILPSVMFIIIRLTIGRPAHWFMIIIGLLSGGAFMTAAYLLVFRPWQRDSVPFLPKK